MFRRIIFYHFLIVKKTNFKNKKEIPLYMGLEELTKNLHNKIKLNRHPGQDLGRVNRFARYSPLLLALLLGCSSSNKEINTANYNTAENANPKTEDVRHPNYAFKNNDFKGIYNALEKQKDSSRLESKKLRLFLKCPEWKLLRFNPNSQYPHRGVYRGFLIDTLKTMAFCFFSWSLLV